MKKPRVRSRMGPVLAVACAAAVAGFGLWLLDRPIRLPAHLSELNPPPALLDQPFRHQFAVPVASALSR